MGHHTPHTPILRRAPIPILPLLLMIIPTRTPLIRQNFAIIIKKKVHRIELIPSGSKVDADVVGFLGGGEFVAGVVVLELGTRAHVFAMAVVAGEGADPAVVEALFQDGGGGAVGVC